jgi:hypothetical protein
MTAAEVAALVVLSIAAAAAICWAAVAVAVRRSRRGRPDGPDRTGADG